MAYRSTKTWGPERGLSACFRQHGALSHCHRLHGYALSVALVFEAKDLDRNHWVIDFGSLKPVKAWLDLTFDHTLLVAEDDPHRAELEHLQVLGLAAVRLVPATGCEAFASLIYDHVNGWLHTEGHKPRVTLVSVEVREHGANSGLRTTQ